MMIQRQVADMSKDFKNQFSKIVCYSLTADETAEISDVYICTCSNILLHFSLCIGPPPVFVSSARHKFQKLVIRVLLGLNI
jgi:hypothetical protein